MGANQPKPIPLLGQWTVLLLSLVLCSWGLQAKLSLYHTTDGRLSTTNSMAKLTVDNRAQAGMTSQRTPSRSLPSIDLQVLTASFFPAHHPASSRLPEIPTKKGDFCSYLACGPTSRRPPPALFS